MARNAGLYALGSVLVSLIGVATDPLLSHYLSRRDFGVVGLTGSLAGLFSALYIAGMDSAAGRAWYDIADQPIQRQRTIGTFNSFALAWLLVLTVAQELWGPALYARFLPDVPYLPFGRLVAAALLLNALSAVPRALWAANEDVQILVRIRVVASLLATGVLLALLWGWQQGPLAVLVAQVIVPLLMLPVFLRFGWGRFGFAWDTAALRAGLAFGLPMVVHLSSHWALNAADRLVLEDLAGTDAVGLYSAAYNASTTALVAINLNVNGAYVPQFTRAYDKPDQQAFVGQAMSALIGAAALAAVAFVLVGPPLVRLFYDARYAQAAQLFTPLCLATVAHAFYLVAVNTLFAAKRTTVLPLLTVTAGVANIGLCYWWIPRFGLAGAAWATTASYAILAALVALAARRIVQLPWQWRRIGVLMAVVALASLVRTLMPPLPVATDLAVGIALALAAPALLWVAGVLEPDEKAWVVAAVRRKLGRGQP